LPHSSVFFPNSHLAAVLRPDAAKVLEGLPFLDEIIPWDKKSKHRGIGGLRKLAAELKSREFETLLSPHSSHRTGFLSYLSGVPNRYGFVDAGFSRFAYTHRLARQGNLPEIKRLLDFLDQSIAPGAASASTDLHLAEDDAGRAEAESILRSHDAIRPILLAPSSVWATKRWTPYGFAELAGKLVKKHKCRVFLVGSPDDRALCDQVLNFVKDFQHEYVQEKVVNVAGDTSLRGFFSLVKRSRLMVSNDSAPVHYACAARIPVVALFGPTVPALGYAPITKNSRTAEIDLACRPCGTHGAKVCPLLHFRCMKELTADLVMEKIAELEVA
jgi:heptosyltransferase-2